MTSWMQPGTFLRLVNNGDLGLKEAVSYRRLVECMSFQDPENALKGGMGMKRNAHEAAVRMLPLSTHRDACMQRRGR